jgi:hypothetical protein
MITQPISNAQLRSDSGNVLGFKDEVSPLLLLSFELRWAHKSADTMYIESLDDLLASCQKISEERGRLARRGIGHIESDISTQHGISGPEYHPGVPAASKKRQRGSQRLASMSFWIWLPSDIAGKKLRIVHSICGGACNQTKCRGHRTSVTGAQAG